jgi:hypothetical protein
MMLHGRGVGHDAPQTPEAACRKLKKCISVYITHGRCSVNLFFESFSNTQVIIYPFSPPERAKELETKSFHNLKPNTTQCQNRNLSSTKLFACNALLQVALQVQLPNGGEPHEGRESRPSRSMATLAPTAR